MTRVVFRFDASADIGLGHASRCATLATELASRGAQVTMVGRGLDARGADHAAFERLSLNEAGWDPGSDAAGFRSLLNGRAVFDWLVVDHYALGAEWERNARALAHRILVIDDLAARPHDCDLLLDQNLLPAQRATVYEPFVPPSAKVLAGPRYALLRPRFAELRRATRQRDGRVRSLLICFGGSDPGNHTRACLEALEALAPRFPVTVVIGRANPHGESVTAAARRVPGTRVLGDPPDLPKLMADADLIVGAGGTMTWERACLGVPTLAIGIADNQAAVLEGLFAAGAAVGETRMPVPDVERMREWLAVALRSPELLSGLANRARALADGEGARRVADAMSPGSLSFRAARPEDRDATHAWRNSEQIRAVSGHSREIALDEHRAWFERTLANPQRVLLIAEVAGRPVGVVRFDIDDPATAVISVYRVPDSKPARLGLVRGAVEWLRENRPHVTRIVATVMAGNEASYRAFMSAGFHEASRELTLEMDHR
jgi:UDP-2,4-diacetamido-2,4,6-trideoxy-beta-L-altropyranose hydrolase